MIKPAQSEKMDYSKEKRNANNLDIMKRISSWCDVFFDAERQNPREKDLRSILDQLMMLSAERSC